MASMALGVFPDGPYSSNLFLYRGQIVEEFLIIWDMCWASRISYPGIHKIQPFHLFLHRSLHGMRYHMYYFCWMSCSHPWAAPAHPLVSPENLVGVWSRGKISLSNLRLFGWVAILFPAVVLGMSNLLTVATFGFPLMATLVSGVVIPTTDTTGWFHRFFLLDTPFFVNRVCSCGVPCLCLYSSTSTAVSSSTVVVSTPIRKMNRIR